METYLDKDISIGIGHSNQADPFQRGREAAQVARGQIKDCPFEMVLALGPPGPPLQDFVEGVRLVTGEEKLIGVPAQHIFTNDLFLSQGGLVLIYHSNSTHTTLAAQEHLQAYPEYALTSILSQLRKERGNICHQFEHSGTLVFDNTIDTNKSLLNEIGLIGGIESWNIHLNLPKPSSFLRLKDTDVKNGYLAIEFLSNDPWGMGSFSLEAFNHEPQTILKGFESALRESLSQMTSSVCLALFFTSLSLPSGILTDLKKILASEGIDLSQIPIVGFDIQKQSVKYRDRILKPLEDSIVALLAPL